MSTCRSEEPLTTIKVHDNHGSVTSSVTIEAYLGDVNSKIVYDLKPDKNLSTDADGEHLAEEARGMEDEENQWITGIADVLGEWEVVGGKNRGVCGHLVDGRAGRNSAGVEDMF